MLTFKFTYSQAALRALDSPHITSRSVLTCRISLDEIATQMNICLCWVPGHSDIAGNCKDDELAREGGIPIATLKLKFEQESSKEVNVK